MWEKHHYKTKICILQWIRFHQSLISKNINVKNLTHLHCIEAEMWLEMRNCIHKVLEASKVLPYLVIGVHYGAADAELN